MVISQYFFNKGVFHLWNKPAVTSQGVINCKCSLRRGEKLTQRISGTQKILKQHRYQYWNVLDEIMVFPGDEIKGFLDQTIKLLLCKSINKFKWLSLCSMDVTLEFELFEWQCSNMWRPLVSYFLQLTIRNSLCYCVKVRAFTNAVYQSFSLSIFFLNNTIVYLKRKYVISLTKLTSRVIMTIFTAGFLKIQF